MKTGVAQSGSAEPPPAGLAAGAAAGAAAAAAAGAAPPTTILPMSSLQESVKYDVNYHVGCGFPLCSEPTIARALTC
jgi:hypothetical protein